MRSTSLRIFEFELTCSIRISTKIPQTQHTQTYTYTAFCFCTDNIPRIAASPAILPISQLIDTSAVDSTSRWWSGIVQLPPAAAGMIARLRFQCRGANPLSGVLPYSIRLFNQGDSSTPTAPCNPCAAVNNTCSFQGPSKVRKSFYHVYFMLKNVTFMLLYHVALLELQILVEFKISQFSSLNVTEAFSSTVSFESDAPHFGGESVLYETIGGTSMAVSIFPDTFKSLSMPPFDAAPLTFTATQWSTALNATVLLAPIFKEVWHTQISLAPLCAHCFVNISCFCLDFPHRTTLRSRLKS